MLQWSNAEIRSICNFENEFLSDCNYREKMHSQRTTPDWSNDVYELVERVKMLQIGFIRQWNGLPTLAEKSNLYLSFSCKWTVSSNERAIAYLRKLRSNRIISAIIKWCRFMSRMDAYCRIGVDHFRKMWKSLTPKSIYREVGQGRFLIEICFGAISIRNRGRPARPCLPWLARMHFPNARTWRKQVVTYWTHDFQKQIPVINLLCAISIRSLPLSPIE